MAQAIDSQTNINAIDPSFQDSIIIAKLHLGQALLSEKLGYDTAIGYYEQTLKFLDSSKVGNLTIYENLETVRREFFWLRGDFNWRSEHFADAKMDFLKWSPFSGQIEIGLRYFKLDKISRAKAHLLKAFHREIIHPSPKSCLAFSLLFTLCEKALINIPVYPSDEI